TPPRTHIARSIVDAVAWARSDDDARALVAAAFQQRRVTEAEVHAVLEVLPKVHRRGLILETTRLAAGGAHSVSEVDFLRLCRRYRLPQPDRQVIRRDQIGRTRYLDAHWPAFR